METRFQILEPAPITRLASYELINIASCDTQALVYDQIASLHALGGATAAFESPRDVRFLLPKNACDS